MPLLYTQLPLLQTCIFRQQLYEIHTLTVKMSNTTHTRDNNTSSQLGEERRRHQQAFWKYCISNLRTIELACPPLYHEVNSLILERRARVLGRPGTVHIPSCRPPLIDLDMSIVSEEWPQRSTTASNTSLISTLAPSQVPECELQGDCTAQGSVHTEVGVDTSQVHSKSGSEVLAEYVYGGLGLSHPQPDISHRPRILFELPTDKQKAPLTGPHGEVEAHYKVLGALHGHAEAQCTVEVGSIRVSITFVPWKDDVLLTNNLFRPISITSKSDKLVVFELQPRKSAVIDPGYWILHNDSTCLQFQLRPCGYHILLQVETNKRAADNTSSPSKKVRVFSKRLSDRGEVPDLDLAVTGKLAVQPVSTVEADSLASSGVPVGHTLAIVDSVTGDVEYAIKRLGSWLMERKHAVIFKANLRKDTESKLVIVKIHKPLEGDTDPTLNAIQRWKREVRAHRGLHHVSCI